MQLRRGDVLAGALALLDAEGLDGLTMRKLAGRLGVQAGGLYWHFASKQALLEAMAEHIIDGVGAPLLDGPWDEQTLTIAHRLRDALLSHRDGARVVAGTYVVGPNTLAVGSLGVDVLTRAGLPAERAGWVMFALSEYVLGHTIEEQSQKERAAAVAIANREASDAIAAQSSPPEAKPYLDALRAVTSADPADRFRYGLDLFLDGLRQRLRR